MTPLSRAIIYSRTSIVTILLSHPSADLHRSAGREVSEYCYRPIHYATLSGDLEILRLLIQAGADVNSRTADSDGTTPVHAAVNGGHEFPEGVVRMLASAGVEVGGGSVWEGGDALGVYAVETL